MADAAVAAAVPAPAKHDDLIYDLGLLAASDMHPLDPAALAADREGTLLRAATENVQLLLKHIFELPAETAPDVGPVVRLVASSAVCPASGVVLLSSPAFDVQASSRRYPFLICCCSLVSPFFVQLDTHADAALLSLPPHSPGRAARAHDALAPPAAAAPKSGAHDVGEVCCRKGHHEEEAQPHGARRGRGRLEAALGLQARQGRVERVALRAQGGG